MVSTSRYFEPEAEGMYLSQRLLEWQAAQSYQEHLRILEKVSEGEELMFEKEGRSDVRMYPRSRTGPLTTWYGKTPPESYIPLSIGQRNRINMFAY